MPIFGKSTGLDEKRPFGEPPASPRGAEPRKRLCRGGSARGRPARVPFFEGAIHSVRIPLWQRNSRIPHWSFSKNSFLGGLFQQLDREIRRAGRLEKGVVVGMGRGWRTPWRKRAACSCRSVEPRFRSSSTGSCRERARSAVYEALYAVRLGLGSTRVTAKHF